jgi:hypothetical protein
MPLNSIIMLHTCVVEAVICYTAENSHHLKAQVTSKNPQFQEEKISDRREATSQITMEKSSKNATPHPSAQRNRTFYTWRAGKCDPRTRFLLAELTPGGGGGGGGMRNGCQDDPNIIIMPLNIIIMLLINIFIPLHIIIKPLNIKILPLNIIIIPFNNIIMPRNIIFMPLNSIMMPLNNIMMPHNIIFMQHNIIIIPLIIIIMLLNSIIMLHKIIIVPLTSACSTCQREKL